MIYALCLVVYVSSILVLCTTFLKSHIARERKSAEWKVMIAHYLKRHTAATKGWLSRHLNMGITTGVSRYVALFEGKGKHKGRTYKRRIARMIP